MKNPRSTKSQQERSVNEGRGRGEGDQYQSHILITRNSLASQGRSAYTPSVVVNRHHDELSHLESKINLVLPLFRLIDVREGYRLQLFGVEEEFEESYPYARGTVQIATALGYRHPRVDDGEHFIMSTDFVATRYNFQMLAVNGKYRKDLSKSRNLELIHIEKVYWQDRGVRHVIATEDHFNRKLVNNLEMMASYRPENVLEVSPQWFVSLAQASLHQPMRIALRSIDSSPECRLIDTVKKAVATGRISTDLVHRQLRWDMVWPRINPHGEEFRWFDGETRTYE